GAAYVFFGRSVWPGTAPVFTADFSNTTGNNAVTSDGLWHLTNRRSGDPGHGGGGSYYFGNEATGTYANGSSPLSGPVTTGDINLTAATDAQLTFNYFLATEDADGFDLAKVEASQPGSTTAFDVLTDNRASGLLVDNTGVWRKATIHLTAQAGRSVRLRFEFDSVDGVGNNFEGFYIDDVTVRAILSVSTADLTINGAPGEALGASVAGLGDVNQGGRDDFAVLANGPPLGGGASNGRVLIFYGENQAPSGALISGATL